MILVGKLRRLIEPNRASGLRSKGARAPARVSRSPSDGDRNVNWVAYAALSAVFAGLTAVLAKIGVSDIPSNVATLVRTVVVVVFATGIVAAAGQLHQLRSIPGRSWLALVFSGVATGLSWLFYFAALKHGPVSGVAPIDKLSFVIAMTLGFLVLGETARPLTLVGAALILAGVLLTLPSVQDFLGGRPSTSPPASAGPEVNRPPPPPEPPPQASARPG